MGSIRRTYVTHLFSCPSPSRLCPQLIKGVYCSLASISISHSHIFAVLPVSCHLRAFYSNTRMITLGHLDRSAECTIISTAFCENRPSDGAKRGVILPLHVRNLHPYSSILKRSCLVHFLDDHIMTGHNSVRARATSPNHPRTVW